MNVFGNVILFVSAYVAAWALYVVLVPAVARLPISRALVQENARRNVDWPFISVVVPAHNMRNFVVRCVHSLRACDYPQDKVTIFVIADHCSDETAELSLDAGACVLVREDGPRGKTYALAWTIDEFRRQGVTSDLVVIVDATARVDPGFLRALAVRWMEGEDIVIGRAILDVENQQWFARCLGLTLAHRNLQNAARDRLGLTAFISGRGMGYGSRYIEKYGWSLALPTSTGLGTHPTEDWRHGVRIAGEGLRAAFVENALVYTPLRGSIGAATEQGIRWERGRMANATTHGWRLLVHGVRQRDTRRVFAALDSLQPPVAVVAGLSMVLAFLSVAVATTPLRVFLGIAPLALIFLYGLAVLGRGRREGVSPSTVLWAPVYIGWRCFSFALAVGRFTGSGVSVRTKRESSSNSSRRNDDQ